MALVRHPVRRADRRQGHAQAERVGGHVPGVGQQRERVGDEADHDLHDQERDDQRERGSETSRVACPSPHVDVAVVVAHVRQITVGTVIRRLGKNLGVLTAGVPEASVELERDGFTVLRDVFTADEVMALTAEIEGIFAATPPERVRTDKDEFRYQMLNRGACCQAAIGHPSILAAIEPLLGDDCHVLANTAWNNPPEFGGGPWHCDAGPHVPRPPGIEWDTRIPYPVFAIGAHILLRACELVDGPTAVVPGSHRSGRLAPFDRVEDPELSYDGRPPVVMEGRAGDVSLFVSDVWHRGMPAVSGQGRGRLFLQVHYGRRDIAQRIRTTSEVNQLSMEAVQRAKTRREKTLIGLHDPMFYDA